LERPKIAGFYRRLYRYICIDEAQDLNEAQYRLLQALSGSSYRNLMLVGDPKQEIFQCRTPDIPPSTICFCAKLAALLDQ